MKIGVERRLIWMAKVGAPTYKGGDRFCERGAVNQNTFTSLPGAGLQREIEMPKNKIGRPKFGRQPSGV
jgi:hypothetical protein